MSLLAASMTTASLLTHRLLAWTRSRPTPGTTNPTTGDYVPGAPATATVNAWFSWLSERQQQDYQADAAAILLAPPGSLSPGDTITNTSLGSFIVLDGGVKPMGEYDRAELKRSA